MRRRVLMIGGSLLVLVTLVAVGVTALGASSSAGQTSHRSRVHVTTLTMQAASAYRPHAPAGATDDYHCTLVNPHVTHNSYIISSHFFPNSAEVHHAILFLVPPGLARTAEADNVGGKGWSCFGESALPHTSLADISNTPWLTAWAPGHGADVEPIGTGVPFPKGSLVVMQEHYNLLVGDKPVRSKLELDTVPETTPLDPLNLDLLPAPPNVPCPTGATGPLCSRTAELANLGQRFGESAVIFDDTIERICGENPNDPPVGDTASCTWPLGDSGYIVRLGVHMHLLGVSMKFVLDPGTPQARTLLDVPDYNFHYQRSYNLAKAVPIKPGDRVQVTCTYNPSLEQTVPILRRVPPHFVVWGDGSTDEMCLGLVLTTPYAPHPVDGV